MIKLSKREEQVLRAVCADPGSLLDIAPTLNIAPGTLKRHLRKIGERTGAESRIHLMHWAWQNGIAPCPCGKH